RIEASEPDVVVLDEGADIGNGVPVHADAAALHFCEAERLRFARPYEQPALLQQLLEVDLEVLASGMNAPLDLDVWVVAVPVQHPDTLGRGNAQQREAGRAREKLGNLEQRFAHATVGDGGRYEVARVVVTIQEDASRDCLRVAPGQHRGGPWDARHGGFIGNGPLGACRIVFGVVVMVLGGAATVITGGAGGLGLDRLPQRRLEADVDEPFGAAGIAVQPVRYVLVVGVPGKPWQPDNADGGGRAVQGLCRSEGFLLAGPVRIREGQDIPPRGGFAAARRP